MKRKILKIVTVILLLALLTMPNFIYVGTGLVSYAVDSIATNHQNVEFDAKLKEGNILSVFLNVKKEGYFNGEINLENSNFTFKLNQENPYINKLESNKLVLNQINSGSNVQIDLQIQPITDEVFDIGLLNASSKVNIEGIYRDSTERDISIKATREVKLEYTEDNTNENIENTTKVITNKVIKISGEDKRVVQLEMNLGLKGNNYPIQKINSIVTVPEIEGKKLEIVDKVDFNTMRDFTYNFDGKNKIELTFNNEAKEENDNKIIWKKQGNEKVILTLIYDKDVTLENSEIQYEEKVTLYNGKELTNSSKLVVDNEEKEELIKLTENSAENTIYKGKLGAGIDRQYETKTNIAVNLANAEQYINVNEGETKYIVQDGQEVSANAIFNKTLINKDSFNKILGENGQITISNGTEIIATINNKTVADENNNLVIDYSAKELKSLNIRTTIPVLEGNLELVHIKTIKQQDAKIVKSATELVSKSTYEYNENELKEEKTSIKLEETKLETGLVVDKDTLSTVISNTVEMKAILKGNSEQYELYKNPSITFELPEDVENAIINDVKLVYENELKIRNYEVNGRNLTIYLEGEQTEYKNPSIEGAIVVVNANITMNKRASTKDSKITMTVNNQENAVTESKAIKVVAPKDITAINSIKELNVETIGQEEIVKATLERGKGARQLETNFEIINNNENAIEDVKIIGMFPTRNTTNNIDIKIIEGINIEGIENAKVYYTEKEDATEDIENIENAWKEKIEDASKVKKYLIIIPSIAEQSSLQGSYKLEIPELLEYNQSAIEAYSVKSRNSLTKMESEVKATSIGLETGVGPVLETKLIQTIAGSELKNNDTIKNGEVIKYKVEVSNTGSEELTDVLVIGNVPEGTTLVTPQENFEYTGASYYKELDNKTYEAKIEKIAVGQVITGEYEVRVNNNTQSGTKINNVAQIKYGDVIKQSNETSLITENGDIRVSVKRVTDRSVDLYESGTVQYFAIIENISDTKQDDIQIKTNLPEGLEVERLNLITGMKSVNIANEELYATNNNEKQEETREITENELVKNDSDNSIKSEEIKYENSIDIGALEKDETKVLSYDMLINKTADSGRRDFSVIATSANKEYKSNVLSDNIKKVDVSLNMATNTQSQYIKSGDILEYTITVKNNGTERIEGLKIKDVLPESLSITKLSIDNETVEQNSNEVDISCNIAAKSEMVIKIETIVNYSAARTSAEAISNVAYAEMLGEKVATTSEINHIIKADEEDIENPANDNPTGDIANGKGTITGVAWFDENANGKKDEEEKTLNNVKAYLLNTATNNLVKDASGKTLEATTNDNGLYVLDHIGNGKYIVIFDYNKTLYTLTKYKVENAQESENSNVMTNELLIENEKQQVASTDIIEINDSNVSNINIGLIELKDFAFRLDKYVSRILIQNSAGTVVKEYTNASVAKAELDAKKVNGTTVIIEYELKVTNIGEIGGYVRKIVDYVPNDLKFSSELNKDWYQVGSDLYNSSLANEKIEAGESKSVKLVLTKAMTENNTGLINNTAEIAESYNELGIIDSKSTGGNKAQGENDYSSADTILSIKTGEEVYATFIAIGIILLGITTIVIVRKKQKIDDITGDIK